MPHIVGCGFHQGVIGNYACIDGVPKGALEVHGPVPDEAVRMPLPDGGQLPFEIFLAYIGGRLELDVVCRYLVVHAKSVN